METDEVLEPGYGPRAPRGDNLLNEFVQGEADAFAELGHAAGSRVEHDDEFDLMLADGGSGSLFANPAILRRPLLEHEWPEAARRMHDFYGAGPGGPFLVYSGWPTPDVRDLGFGAIGHPPLMLRLPGDIATSNPEGFALRRVEDAPAAAQFERTLALGYPIPEVDPDLAGCFIGPNPAAAPGWRHFLGLLDGEPVATGSAWVGEHHVHIEFISTLPDARGRGIGHAVTAAVTRADPELPALLIASDLGRPVYDRMGYLTITRFTMWAGHRGEP
jgi:GNAT superfamily N-acetyltransferase